MFLLIMLPNNLYFFIIFLFVFTRFESVSSGNFTGHESILNRCGKVFLTVSSYKHTFLELNWVLINCKPNDAFRPDQIALYDSDPRLGNAREYIKINPLNYVDEFYRTSIPFQHPQLPGNWDYSNNSLESPTSGHHCFPYWIASLKENKVIHTECFKIQPTWMADNSKSLENLEIGKAFLPGTHNSGTYQHDAPILDVFSVNQDRDVWTQLVFGIRYLDFRVAYYKKNDQFTINHDVVRFGPVDSAFEQLKTFLKLAPKEIIVLDFHRFPYPVNFPHDKFINYLETYFADFLFPQSTGRNSKGHTFGEIWESKRNLIICYNDRSTYERYPEMVWRPLLQYWGDKRSPKDLKNFIQNTITSVKNNDIHNRFTNPLWAIMAELTPSKFDILFGLNNLRQLADRINLLITQWFRDLWINDVNVVATDFFLGNDLINIAIEANLIKTNSSKEIF